MSHAVVRNTREFWRVASRRTLIALLVAAVIAGGTSMVSLNIATSHARFYVLWSSINLEYTEVPNMKPAAGASVVPPGLQWSFRMGESGGVRFLAIPLWSPVAVFGLAFAACEYRRRTAIDEGACGHCGYDLRGIGAGPDGRIVCPECARRA